MSTPASTLNNTGVMLNSVDTSDNTGYSNHAIESKRSTYLVVDIEEELVQLDSSFYYCNDILAVKNRVHRK